MFKNFVQAVNSKHQVLQSANKALCKQEKKLRAFTKKRRNSISLQKKHQNKKAKFEVRFC